MVAEAEGDVAELKRLVLDYRSGELVARVLYRSEDGPNPGTKRRTKVVADLARSGLRDALEALDAGDGAEGDSSEDSGGGGYRWP
jgi:hypothetical protein